MSMWTAEIYSTAEPDTLPWVGSLKYSCSVLRTTCKFLPTQNKRNQMKTYISALQMKSRNNFEQPLQFYILSTIMRLSVLALFIALPAAAYAAAANPNDPNTPQKCTAETQPCGKGLPACCGGNLDCRLDDASTLVCFF